jgi:hypothetical protein
MKHRRRKAYHTGGKLRFGGTMAGYLPSGLKSYQAEIATMDTWISTGCMPVIACAEVG